MTHAPETPQNDAKTWGPNEVYWAAGVTRGVAHSWVARKLVPLGPAPGMGKERRFSYEEVVLFGIVTELTRLGVGIGEAAQAAEALTLDERFRARALREDGWFIVIQNPSTAPVGATKDPRLGRALFCLSSIDQLGSVVVGELKHPAAFATVDLSELKRRLTEKLSVLDGGPRRQD